MTRRVASGWGESRPRGGWIWLATAVLAAAAAGIAAVVTAPGGADKAGAQAVDPADLSLAKTDSPDPVIRREVLTYTLEVENAGPDPATNTVVEDQLPSSVDPLSADTSVGTCDTQGKAVTCELGELASAATATVTITVRPKNAGQIANTASVQSDVADPQTANNVDAETTTVERPPKKPKPARCKKRRADIVGTSAGETLTGTDDSEVFKAKGGDDRIEAGGGHDVICAGGGNDFVHAGGGNDFAKGQRGGDTLKGSRGGDTLKGNRGPDNLKGGRGNDLLAGGKGRDSCRGGRGRDTERSC
jgi:uncharacterized repeat protein (TIGR01451 family)